MASPRRNSSKGPSHKLAEKSDRRRRPAKRNTTAPIRRAAVVVDPLGCLTTYKYDIDGYLSTRQEPRSARRSRGRHAIATRQGATAAPLTYTPLNLTTVPDTSPGRLESDSDADDRVTTYIYDSQDRLTTIQYPSDTTTLDDVRNSQSTRSR